MTAKRWRDPVRESTVERAAREYPHVYARLLAACAPDSTIDREQHAANVALTVGPIKTRRRLAAVLGNTTAVTSGAATKEES